MNHYPTCTDPGGHVEDNQGLCHHCGILISGGDWQTYSGESNEKIAERFEEQTERALEEEVECPCCGGDGGEVAPDGGYKITGSGFGDCYETESYFPCELCEDEMVVERGVAEEWKEKKERDEHIRRNAYKFIDRKRVAGCDCEDCSQHRSRMNPYYKLDEKETA